MPRAARGHDAPLWRAAHREIDNQVLSNCTYIGCPIQAFYLFLLQNNIDLLQNKLAAHLAPSETIEEQDDQDYPVRRAAASQAFSPIEGGVGPARLLL